MSRPEGAPQEEDDEELTSSIENQGGSCNIISIHTYSEDKNDSIGAQEEPEKLEIKAEVNEKVRGTMDQLSQSKKIHDEPPS